MLLRSRAGNFRRRKRLGGDLENVSRAGVGVMRDLFAAGESADGDGRVAAIAHGGEEALLADRPGDIMVGGLVPERTGHAAAAAVNFAGVAMGDGAEQGEGVGGADQGFLVTMPV